MTRAHNPDDICAMCNEYSVKLADPTYRDIGMGRCGVVEPGKPHRHVAWDSEGCLSFRKEPDRDKHEQRLIYVVKWRAKEPL